VIILSVHTTSSSLAAAVTSDGSVLEERVLPPPAKHLENLAPMIVDITAGLDSGLATVDAFAAARGPGSFSGVRVGIATVKGLGLALGKPVIGISSLAIIARQALEEGELGIPVIDARRGEIYTAKYRSDRDGLKLLYGPVLIPKDALVRSMPNAYEKAVICGDSVVEDVAIGDTAFVRRVIAQPSAAVAGILAWQRLRKGTPDELHTLTPLYIRRSDAELNK
jgi:tRNA threonylcarbamoyladenosine biosynthesis protein TsaB